MVLLLGSVNSSHHLRCGMELSVTAVVSAVHFGHKKEKILRFFAQIAGTLPPRFFSGIPRQSFFFTEPPPRIGEK